MDVYENGANAVLSDLHGEVGLVSLASLSTEAFPYMKDDLMYSTFWYALYCEDDFDNPFEDYAYAHAVGRRPTRAFRIQQETVFQHVT
jgi:hypothetical protein